MYDQVGTLPMQSPADGRPYASRSPCDEYHFPLHCDLLYTCNQQVLTRLEQISFRSWLNSLKSLDLAFDCNKPTGTGNDSVWKRRPPRLIADLIIQPSIQPCSHNHHFLHRMKPHFDIVELWQS